jgi:hypothetical protein
MGFDRQRIGPHVAAGERGRQHGGGEHLRLDHRFPTPRLVTLQHMTIRLWPPLGSRPAAILGCLEEAPPR